MVDNPIHRFRAFMRQKGWWTETEETSLLAKHKADVLAAFKRAERQPKPKLGEMFNDVWAVKKGDSVPRVIVSFPHSVRSWLIGRWNNVPNLEGC